MKARKQRLKDSKKIAVNIYLSLGTTDVHTKSTNEKSSAQPPFNKEEPKLSCSAASAEPLPSAGAEVSESTTAVKEEKCETEFIANASVTSETDMETSENEKEAEPVSCSALQTGSPLLSDGKEENLPQMNMRHFIALKEVIHQFRKSQSPTKRNEVILFNSFTVCIKHV